MEKVLLTTYRKLYKMGSRVDHSTGMRSILSCAPSHVYHHRRGEWVPINVAKLSSWVESRIFLDNLIRRLNAGRQFYVPPTTAVEREQVEKEMAKLQEKLPHSTEATGDATAAATPQAAASPASGSSSGGSGDAGASAGAAAGASAAQVPLSIFPFTPLLQTLRTLFETTAFSMGNLNNAFAAVKELSYVCEVTDKHQPLVVTLPAELKALPRPNLERVLEVDPIHHVRLIKGLTEEIMESLRMSRRPRSRKAAKAAATSSTATPSNAFDDVEGTGRPTQSEEEEHEGLFDEEVDDDEEDPTGTGASSSAPLTSAALSAAANAQGECSAVPKHVQLLLAHPQLSGFFRHSVLLVVRNAENEAAAFIVNKPLENDEGLRMPVNATIRLNRVHPVFGKFLRNHTIMVGGPVMVGGAFDESIFLLHSIPEVSSALPLGNGLWLDGDLDNLMEKLQSGAASPSQVVVLCGFSGWGVDQLSGEVDAGTWVIASGDAEDKAVPAFVMQLAHVSGAHAAPMDDIAAPPAPGKEATEGKVSEESAEDQEAAADPARLSVRISANRRATASWVWAYDALGEPLASLATNQKPESGAEFSE